MGRGRPLLVGAALLGLLAAIGFTLASGLGRLLAAIGFTLASGLGRLLAARAVQGLAVMSTREVKR